MDTSTLKARAQAVSLTSTFLRFCWSVLWKSALISIAIVALSYLYLSMRDGLGIALALFILVLVVFALREAWFEIADPPAPIRAFVHAAAFLIFVLTFFSVAYGCIYLLHRWGVLPGVG